MPKILPMTDEQELWLLRYVIARLPERPYERLHGAKMPAIDLEVFRQLVEDFVDEAAEARAGEAFREQVESIKP